MPKVVKKPELPPHTKIQNENWSNQLFKPYYKESKAIDIVTDKEPDLLNIKIGPPEVDDTPSKKSMCANCGFESEIPRIFQKHMESLRKCSECSKVFCGTYAKRQYESHQKKHEVKPVKQKIPFICVHCSKQFPQKSRLKEHLIRSSCGRKTPPKDWYDPIMNSGT